MTKHTTITQEYLKSILNYIPETGEFFWKTRPHEHFKSVRSSKIWNAKYAGKKAGSLVSTGYIKISIDYNNIKAHRIAYAMVYGFWPDVGIDHINGNKLDNRICNLREATTSQNQMNKKATRRNITGYKGVSFNKKSKKYSAVIGIDNKTTHIGLFETAEEAYESYCKKAKELHGKFARLD